MIEGTKPAIIRRRHEMMHREWHEIDGQTDVIGGSSFLKMTLKRQKSFDNQQDGAMKLGRLLPIRPPLLPYSAVISLFQYEVQYSVKLSRSVAKKGQEIAMRTSQQILQS